MAPPNICIGCAHASALKLQSHVDNFRQLVEWQQYALASAMYAYDRALQFKDPREDMIAFLKACIPTVYTDYGTTISHYDVLRRIRQLSTPSTQHGERPSSWRGTRRMTMENCATSATMMLETQLMLDS